jgi:hypothetical protein
MLLNPSFLLDGSIVKQVVADRLAKNGQLLKLRRMSAAICDSSAIICTGEAGF